MAESLHHLIAEDIAGIARERLPWERLRSATVLISGASGMAASYIVHTLQYLNDTQNMNIRLVALVRNPDRARLRLGAALDRPDTVLLAQDVCDPVAYDRPVDYIFHAASPASPKQFSADPVGTLDANALGTRSLLELARQKRTKKFVLLSSAEVYGRAGDDIPLGEEMPGVLESMAARACYPEGKRAAEAYCAAYAQQYGLCCQAARIAHMYGPSMDRDDGHVVAEFIRHALDGRDITLKSDGSMQRAYVYVSDVASGLFTVLLSGEAPVYNITNETQVVSIRELAQAVLATCPGHNLQLRFELPPAAANTGFSPHGVGLLSAARLRNLGWAPRMNLREGLARTFAVLRDGTP